MPATVSSELAAAVQAVRHASVVCRAVQRDLVAGDKLDKDDRSPVTVADFASQAVVAKLMDDLLPGQVIVGEESADALRGEHAALVRKRVAKYASAAANGLDSEQAVLDAIDRGGHARAGGKRKAPDTYWALDPIDGTKGFLRAEQYAVALGKVVDGQPVLGVLGCPNLPRPGGKLGVILLAERGVGAWQLPLSELDLADAEPVSVDGLASPSDARFCESVESGHSDQGTTAQIAARLGITRDPFRIDSQCKYAAVARGDASIYLRMPTKKGYREKVWDHAAGVVVVEAAGGKVTDRDGKPLDFSAPPKLEHNRGIIATNGLIHDAVVDAVAAVGGGVE